MSELIERQAAIDASCTCHGGKHCNHYPCKDVQAIMDLPSVQPQRMKGKWIGTEFDGYADGNPVYYEWKCSVCGCVVEDEEPTWNYCPNCGTDMRGGQDERMDV